MQQVRINPHILRWARERLELPSEIVAKRAGTRPEKIGIWEEGKSQPTFRQLRLLAKALYVPMGYFFLESPPELAPAIPDFRRIPSSFKGKYSIDLQEVLNDALRKRDWYRDWRLSEGSQALEFVGKFKRDNAIVEIVEDIQKTLGIETFPGEGKRSWYDALRYLIERVENAGMMVFQRGVVGSNNNRKLRVEEFRGFAIADSYAPLIFINSNDSIAARLFTLAHELVHLWTGTSGISNPEITPETIINEPEDIERFCNRVAAEFLVPQKLFLSLWQTETAILENITRLSRIFRVSGFVILLRGLHLRMIGYDDFADIYDHLQREALKNEKKEKGSGGNFYATLLSRNSKRFVRELIYAVGEGRALYREAARLLNVKPATVDKVKNRLLQGE